MSTEKLSVDQSMSAGWNLLCDNFWTYARLASLAILLMFLPDIASSAIGLSSNFAVFAIVLSILGLVLKAILPLGIINLQIRIVNGQSISSDDLWTPWKRYPAFLGATLIYGWVVCMGLLFLVVPGIIFGIMFQFYPYFIVEHKLGPIQALKASAAITAGAMWELFFLGLLLGIIQAVAGLTFLGLLPAQVFQLLTTTSVYKTLLNNTPADELPFPYESSVRKIADPIFSTPIQDAGQTRITETGDMNSSSIGLESPTGALLETPADALLPVAQTRADSPEDARLRMPELSSETPADNQSEIPGSLAGLEREAPGIPTDESDQQSQHQGEK
jgi:hypothetical protein